MSAVIKKSNNPFLRKQKENLKIIFPEIFRDEFWANEIGKIQNKIRKHISEENGVLIDQVIFDFSYCRWVDPFPLLSVLFEILAVRKQGIKVLLNLPKSDAGQKNICKEPYHKSPNRFLFFLANEGFLNTLESLGDKGITFINKPKSGWELYKTLNVQPSYINANCIPMKFFFVPNNEKGNDSFAKKAVETLLEGIDSNLYSKLSTNSRVRLIYKIRVALQEFLHNAQEHAYEKNSEERLFAIYVRFRTGGIGLDTTGMTIFKSCINEEKKHCPMLHKAWLENRSGCIEIFALDYGMGMVKSFEKAGINLKWKYKFSQVMYEAFSKGKSTKTKRNTPFGGLHLLHNLLSDTGDYIRAFENGVWFGSTVPIDRPTKSTQALTKTSVKMKGLAIHLQLGWKEETDLGDKWASFNKIEKELLWNELNYDELECRPSFDWFSSQTIFDERFGNFENSRGQGDWVLWFVHPHRMKWDILSHLENKIIPAIPKKAKLIIADIPSYEAETYAAAIGNLKIAATWPSKLSHIILVTDRYRFAFCAYKSYSGLHGFSPLYEDFEKISFNILIKPKPKNFRLAIIRWIKWYDSQRIWFEVNQNDLSFIPQKIFWGEDEDGDKREISGYLDFSQTTHNQMCLSLYQKALSRILGVLYPINIKIHSLDRLSMPILREIELNWLYESKDNFGDVELALGSVLVTGSTLESSSSLEYDLHFFIHRDSPLKNKKPSIFFWLPMKKILINPPQLERIGKSSSIAPEGWKSYEVPRYDVYGNCIGDRNPENTYQDWQSLSPVIVKSGHWSYEGHHDFLTINIVSAVESSFLEVNELALFLVNNILKFIGINIRHIIDEWREPLKSIFDTKNRSKNSERNGIMVYRSHPSTDSIINLLLKILNPEGKQLALSKIFPVLPVRMRWGGSTFLIPPLVRNEIEEALKNNDGERDVLLFDDASITGRTMQDLRAALSSIGAEKINMVVIANRLRQPYDGRGKERLSYFWRLDLPIMGHEGNCPLCHAVQLVDSFSSLLASSKYVNNLKIWTISWLKTSPINSWNEGLYPLPLRKPELGTKYCYRKSLKKSDGDNHFANLDLIRSTGIVIHISELHAMTGRDDYCLKKIKEHIEPEIRIEIAASQLLLFGHEFDMDIRIELLKTLLRELILLNPDSKHSSLAFLVILYGIGLIDVSMKKRMIESVLNGWAPHKNLAAKIILAYFVSEGLIHSNSVFYTTGKRFLSTSSWSMGELFNNLYREILSSKGNSHSEAIPLLIDDLSKTPDIKPERFESAIESTYHIEDIIKGVERGWARRRDITNLFDENKKAIQKTAPIVEAEILNFLNSDIASDSCREKLSGELIGFLSIIKSISCAFFHRIPIVENYWENESFANEAIPEIINRIKWSNAFVNKKDKNNDPIVPTEKIIKVSKHNTLNFDENSGEIWILWCRSVCGIVQDLMHNAVYAAKQIKDPMGCGDSEEMAHLWIHLQYDKKSVTINFTNHTQVNPEDIYSNLKKERFDPLKKIGGSIALSRFIGNEFYSIGVTLPYAGYLKV